MSLPSPDRAAQPVAGDRFIRGRRHAVVLAVEAGRVAWAIYDSRHTHVVHHNDTLETWAMLARTSIERGVTFIPAPEVADGEPTKASA